MPERFIAPFLSQIEVLWQAAMLVAVGVILSIGRTLQKPVVDQWHVIVGRALTTGTLSLAAGSLLALVPGIPFLGLLGAAAALASLGTDFLARMLTAYITKGKQ